MEKRIDFELDGESLSKALIQLSLETGINIAFSNSAIPEISNLVYSAEEKTILEILDDLLEGLEFTVEEFRGGLALVPEEKNLNNYILNGYLRNADTGEKLVGAEIFVDVLGIGTYSNEFGFFRLSIPEGVHMVDFSYLGYGHTVNLITIDQDVYVYIELSPSFELNEVIIYGREYWKIFEQSTNVSHVPLQTLDYIPGVGGSMDPVQFIRRLSGVQSTGDGIGGISVRGGNPEQNLFLFDGARIYNPSHANGLVSLFSDKMLNSARFFKTPGPARYNGGLSSVFDLQTKQANNRSLQVNAQVDLVSTSITIENPLKKEKSSLLISARKSHLNKITRFKERVTIDDNIYEAIEPDFYDIFGKASFKLSDRTDLSLSYFRSRDNYSDGASFVKSFKDGNFEARERVNLNYKSEIGILNFNSRISKLFFVKFSGHFSSYNNTYSNTFDRIQTDSQGSEVLFRTSKIDAFSEIQDIGGDLQLDWNWNKSYGTRLGVSVLNHDYAPGQLIRQTLSKDLSDNQVEEFKNKRTTENFSECSAFIENRFDFSGKVKINAGLNAIILTPFEANQIELSPRLNLEIAASKSFSIYANLSRSVQYYNTFRDAGIHNPTDLFIPGTSGFPAQTAWITGTSMRWHNLKNVISIGGFYKEMQNLLLYEKTTGEEFFGLSTLEDINDQLISGEGIARGLEVEWTKSGKTEWNSSYTLSKGQRKFEKLNLGNYFFAPSDRKHKFNAHVTQHISPTLKFSVAASFMSGTPITAPFSEIDRVDPFSGKTYQDPNFLRVNNMRIPDYFRLDAMLDISLQGEKLRHGIAIGVYNLSNRENPLYYRYSHMDAGKPVFLKRGLLPISPIFRYSVSLVN